MADSDLDIVVRDDENRLVMHETVSVTHTFPMVHRHQLTGACESFELWDSAEMDAIFYVTADAMVAPLGCQATLDVGGTPMVIPDGRWLYVIVGGSTDVSCSIDDSARQGCLVDIVIRGEQDQGD